ncbi:hypothetical protein Micbo1qcDRAFT_128718, partial [Microdochium bolleyi]
GDLWIRTQRHGDSDPANNFLVDSKTLARHSEVFDRMLYGNFADAKQDSDSEPSWSVELPEDLSTPMRWLFQVMHGDFRSTEISMFTPGAAQSIFQLAVAPDKYDCVALFRPWVVAWDRILEPSKTTIYASLCELAWTAYTIGSRRNYEAAMTKLVIDFAADESSDDTMLGSLRDLTYDLRG